MQEFKPCPRCPEQRHWTGTRWRCSRCHTEYQQKKRAATSPEQREAQLKRDRSNAKVRRTRWSPEKRAQVNRQIAEWREANRDRHRAGVHDWYMRTAEVRRAAKAAEYRSNPERWYAANLLRKARLNDAVCEHGPKCVTDDFLAELYASECTYCGQPAQHADHFYPIARGGIHCVENIVPACQPCNNSKCARDPWEFMAN